MVNILDFLFIFIKKVAVVAVVVRLLYSVGVFCFCFVKASCVQIYPSGGFCVELLRYLSMNVCIK